MWQSVVRIINRKHGALLYGLNQVIERIGPVAYKLLFPATSRVHPFSHTSQEGCLEIWFCKGYTHTETMANRGRKHQIIYPLRRTVHRRHYMRRCFENALR